ncbi:hypothetical protein BDV38DRAFT_261065 [Aspergillus pseudotamarii]|uniref:Uncharacterized protein n=1 Tax=Aspergillus pseudotamarii TaxID=132259 RepID=A0A5N6SCM8_ASPPS|nr:uncharacterized protein BDV38DRAFT_261065 [Aspergillus pseudotamarii]KAE8132472.1 hypothetical protein BDV38DRAFT_261065 [Aspergillus pseudotamarii]
MMSTMKDTVSLPHGRNRFAFYSKESRGKKKPKRKGKEKGRWVLQIAFDYLINSFFLTIIFFGAP